MSLPVSLHSLLHCSERHTVAAEHLEYHPTQLELDESHQMLSPHCHVSHEASTKMYSQQAEGGFEKWVIQNIWYIRNIWYPIPSHIVKSLYLHIPGRRWSPYRARFWDFPPTTCHEHAVNLE